MNCSDLLPIVLILLICVVSYRLIINSDYIQLKCIVSTIDGEKYCVRERTKVKAAVDRLAKVNENMIAVVKYCAENYGKQANVRRLKKGFNPKRITETLPTSTLTAYSENKGEKIAFCLNKNKNDNNNLIDLNTLTFVALHELAHVATKSVGHTPEFWNNFKFLLVQAKKINIYNPVDYSKEPNDYCGMTINHNPYYDK